MPKITEQINELKTSIENIRNQMNKIRIENTLLIDQQEHLVSEKADLIKQNELAKNEIKSILERINNLEME
jgi:uncharacterized protein (TIGR02449 family)